MKSELLIILDCLLTVFYKILFVKKSGENINRNENE